MATTKHAVNTYISSHVAAVTSCNAADMIAKAPDCTDWLSGSGLSCIFKDYPPESARPFVVNFIRRIHVAFLEYELGRAALLDLINDGTGRWSPYYVALTHFEVAVSQLCMALDSVRKLSGHDFYKTGDGSFEESLNYLYNAGKHQLAANELPLMLTNVGLECKSAKLTFGEIEDFMLTMAGVARGLYDSEMASRFFNTGTTA